jgi:hypothetical protein
MDNHLYERIRELRKQLINTGYHGFQIDDMIRDIAGSPQIDRLNNGQAEELIEALNEQIQFAFKCRESSRER